jgi:DNA-directed RNA polymerase beta' subunit
MRLENMVEDIDSKRVDYSGRTVIGADPTLKLGEIAVPKKMCEILTFPDIVTQYNINHLQKIVNEGKANFVLKKNLELGAEQEVKNMNQIAPTKTRINLKYAMKMKGTPLLYGDIILRNDQEIEVKNENIKLLKDDKIKRGDVILEDIRYPKLKPFKIDIGDTVERHLTNGDIVLLNRQPTEPLR